MDPPPPTWAAARTSAHFPNHAVPADDATLITTPTDNWDFIEQAELPSHASLLNTETFLPAPPAL